MAWRLKNALYMNRLNGWITAISEYWSLDGGGLMNLRSGRFDAESLKRFIGLLDTIDTRSEPCLPVRFVSLTWLIPTYMSWQTERVVERGGDAVLLHQLGQQAQAHLERILGVACLDAATETPGHVGSRSRFDRWTDELRTLWRDELNGLCGIAEGRFDPSQSERVVALMKTVTVQRDECIPKDFVALVWDLPAYLERHIESTIAAGGSAELLRRDATFMRNELNRFLGGP